MPKIRLYINLALEMGVDLGLSKDDCHYLLNVMRLEGGDEIAVFNGRDGEWLAEVMRLSKKEAAVRPKLLLSPQVHEPDVWLVFAPVKKARIDFMAQKACELGATKLMPIMTHHTSVVRIKIERLQANAKEAAEQCGRMMVPEVTPFQKFGDVLRDWPSGRKIIFCDEDLSGGAALEVLNSQSGDKWAIFIGPEGGWSQNERDLIKKQAGCVTVSLGPRVLRADTAAISALTLFQSTLGDWS